MKQGINTSEEIKRKLWEGANNLRGSMEASKYKDYMLGLMFYKFLSDRTLDWYKKNAGVKNEANLLSEYRNAFNKWGDKLSNAIKSNLRYVIKPQYLYQQWIEDIKNGEFELEKVTYGLEDFERSIAIGDSNNDDDFKGLFSTSIINMSDTALGNDIKKRNKNISDLLMLFADLNMVDLQSTDILGDAYEYLIGQFASDAGKKAGEFYTPRQVSEVMAQIIAKNNEVRSIYDPTVGSGSLLLTVGKHLGKDSQKLLKYYGQEYNTETYNLTRMNLLLHGVSPDYMTIKNGNTMSQDWPEDPNRPGEGVQFDAVVMNPPYSDKKWNSHEDVPLKVSDPRFADFGTLPPDNKGDFAYLLHGLFHLGQQGTMAIVLPHGVLFRGDSEALIRQKLVDKNYLDAIIGLPSNMFKNTGIPVVVLILKKNRNLNDPVLIIDASNDFIKIGKNNVLRDQDIAKIVDTYVQKKEIPNYSHVASYDEIKENGYNLNIPRYVEAIDNELIQDVDGHLLGGIPKKAIQQLSVLKKADPESFNDSFDEIRPGYVRLNQDINELKLNVLNSTIVVRKIDNLKDELENYFKQSFSKLSSISSNSPIDLNELKESLLQEVKSILEKYENVNEYDGYQIMATLWSQYLERDLELISVSNLYEVGKTRQPHMVMKGQGSKRHEEQDGWIGTIVPNELIKNNLFGDQLNSISDLEIKFNDYQNRLDEIRDSLSEDDGEFDVLNDDNSEFNSKEVSKELKDSLSKIDIPEVNRLQDVAKFLEGKPGKQAQIDYMLEHSEINWDKIEKNKNGTIKKSGINNQIKYLKNNVKFSEGSFESKLTEVNNLINKKTKLSKEIKNAYKKLDDLVFEKIENLTDQEIDNLMYEKWFGSLLPQFINLVKSPINKDIDTLNQLSQMYSETISQIDDEINTLEKEFNQLLSELVVK